MSKYVNILMIFLMAGIFKAILHVPNSGLRFLIIFLIVGIWIFFAKKKQNHE
jgi:hypothetical protein